MSPFKNRIFSCIFALLIFATHFETALLTSNEKPDEIGNIADSLQYLDLGELPDVLVNRELPSPVADESNFRPQSPGSSTQEASSAFGTSPRSIFQVKHIFTKDGAEGTPSAPLDSLKELSSDPEFAKRYFAEMNFDYLNGDILPAKGSSEEFAEKYFKNWMEKIEAGEHEITLIDDGMETLLADLDQSTRRGSTVTTKGEHSITIIRFIKLEDDEVALGAIPNKSKLQFTLNEKGEISHFEKALTEPDKTAATELATYTMEELKITADLTEDGWASMDNRPGKNREMALNSDHPEYVSARETFDEMWKEFFSEEPSLRAAPIPSIPGVCTTSTEGCAIVVDPKNGEVQKIDSKEFLEQYKKASATDRQILADLAGKAVEKGIIAAGRDGVKVKGVAGLEEQVSHLRNIQEMIPVEEPSKLKSLGEKLEKAKNVLESAKVKISQTRFASWLASSAKVKEFTVTLNGVVAPLGQFVIVKNLIAGIVKGDTTSLAIIGSRVGIDLVGAGATKFGTKFFQSAATMGKSLKYIGVVASPAGALHDIGAAIYSLTQNVEKLKGATDVFDSNDAIADIVNDSVALAGAVATLAAVALFNPASALVAAVALAAVLISTFVTSIFKTFQEVGRINADVHLSDLERRFVGTTRFFDWFNLRTPDYIDYLVQEKKANDLAVQMNLKFLQDNKQLRGIVFPAKTLFIGGTCRLTESECESFHLFVLGCLIWGEDRVIGEGCDPHKPCPTKLCRNFTDVTNSYRDRCLCNGVPSKIGESRLNQFVDLRNKMNMYHDRTIPKDVEGADFICKPGSTKYLNALQSEEKATLDYRCEDTIGIIQPKDKQEPGQSMYFNLENGTDTVYPSVVEQTPNIFNMGEWGHKEFYCGNTTFRNEYIFNSTCLVGLNGTIAGGRAENDTISIINNKCGQGNQLLVDFKSGRMTLKNSKAFNFNISSIEEITGRKGESDNVTVSCSTRRVALQAGKTGENPDIVNIGEERNCQYNLTMVLDANTTVSCNARNGTINYVFGSNTENLLVSMDVYANSTPKFNFVLNSSSSLTTFKMEKSMNIIQVSLAMNGSSAPGKFRFSNKTGTANATVVPPIYFLEYPPGSPQSVLITGDSENSTIVYHALNRTLVKDDDSKDPDEDDTQDPKDDSQDPKDDDSQKDFNRTGCPVLKNMMLVESKHWGKLVGGNKSDEFVLQWPVEEIHGLEGDDTIRIHSNASQDQVFRFNLSDDSYTGIENIFGSPGKNLEVVAGCDTKLIAALGGNRSSEDSEHIIASIEIPKNQSCTQRNLQMLAKGDSSLDVLSPIGGSETDTVTMFVLAFNSSAPASAQEYPLDFGLSTSANDTSGLHVMLLLEHKNWSIGHYTHDINFEILRAELIGTGKVTEKIGFSFGQAKRWPEQKFAGNIPSIELVQLHESNEPTARLVVEAATGLPTVHFSLGENVTKVTGYAHIPNIFQVLASNNKGVVIDGVGGKSNTFIVDDDNSTSSTNPFSVDLIKGKFGYVLTRDEEKGSITDIQSVVGRLEKPDIIVLNCSAAAVNGLGGTSSSLADIIYNTEQGCEEPQEFAINVHNFTRVVNSAEKGDFTYAVHRLSTSDIQYNATKDNQHQFHFQFYPPEEIDQMTFDFPSETLGFKLKAPSPFLNNSDKLFYNMVRDDSTKEFTNPIFRFQKPEEYDVIISVGVNKNGQIAGSYLIRDISEFSNKTVVGVSPDMNRFMVNITQGRYYSYEPIFSRLVGSKDGKTNEFYILNLDTPLGWLDGGECKNCTNLLYLDKDLLPGSKLDVDLAEGFMNSTERRIIHSVKNIHSVYGRNSTKDTDKLTLTSQTRTIAQVEEVFIQYTDNQTPFNLTIEVGANTSVWFEDSKSFNRSTYNSSMDTFNYVFSSPRSFDPNGTEGFGTWLGGPNHNYIFSFTLDELDFLDFYLEKEQLCYSLINNNASYCHTMLNSLYIVDQFYTQPQMITKDGFRIQVSRMGELYFSLGAKKSFPSQDEIESKIIPLYERVSILLDGTFIVQTDKDYLHVAHDNGSISRNVLQSVSFSTSHLVGAGATNAMYVVSSLEKNNVYIYPGFADDDIVSDYEIYYLDDQVLDLSGIVLDIRMSSGKKYVPPVKSNGKDLVISMDGFEDKHKGKVIIVNGTNPEIWENLQVLLHQTLMHLVHNNQTNEWGMKPSTKDVSSGFLYQTAPEDLEDNHEIVFIEKNKAAPETSFELARNESDLLISNILDVSLSADPINITTLVISSFFEEKIWMPVQNDTVNFAAIPSNISGVMVNFPGANLELNGTRIWRIQPDKTKSEIMRESLPDWASVTSLAEENLLDTEAMPVMLTMDQYERNDRETESGFYGIWNVIVSFLRVFGRSNSNSGTEVGGH